MGPNLTAGPHQNTNKYDRIDVYGYKVLTVFGYCTQPNLSRLHCGRHTCAS